jgi:hypothetical protein
MAAERLVERALLAQDQIEHVQREEARADRLRHAMVQAAG